MAKFQINHGRFMFVIFAIVLTFLLIFPSVLSTPSLSDRGQASATLQAKGSAPLMNEMWPMYGHDWHHSGQGIEAAKGIQEPVLKWSADSAINGWGTTIGRFYDNISSSEFDFDSVVFANDGSIFICDGRDGAVMWKLDITAIDNMTTGELSYSTVGLCDLNGNGRLDIVFGLQNTDLDGWLYAFEPVINWTGSAYAWAQNNYSNGEMLWSYNTKGDMTYSSPVFKDINSDTVTDVIIGVGATTTDGIGHVLALKGSDGSKIFQGNVSGRFVSSPAVFEYNPTTDHIIIASKNTTYYNVYSFNTNGDENWKKAYATSVGAYVQIPSPVIGDFNASMTGLEIAVCIPFVINNNGQVIALRSNGNALWSSPFQATGQFESTPAIYDINGDLSDDVIVISKEALLSPSLHMYAISGKTGKAIWSQSRSAGVDTVVAQPVITDIRTDAHKDVFFTSSATAIALNLTSGAYLWNFSAPTGHSFMSTPAIGDIDMDGFLDIAIDGCAITHKIVDLTLNATDITFNTAQLKENSEAEISALIKNDGKVSASNVLVSFFDNGTLIGSDLLDTVDKTRMASVYWTPANGGPRNISVRADPNGTIDEINESNNEAWKIVSVQEVYSDLTVTALRFFRSDGKLADGTNIHIVAGMPSTVEATVENIGEDNTSLYDLEFRAQAQVFYINASQPDLQPGGSFVLNVSWNVPDAVTSATIAVTADSAQNIPESNELNNALTLAIDIIPKDPGTKAFIVQGKVYMSDQLTPVPVGNIALTDQRTNAQLSGKTNETGAFYINLAEISQGYQEGDTVELFASDASGNYSNKTILTVFSEDGYADMTITLKEVEQYNFKLVVPDKDQSVNPSNSLDYYLLITNLGNRPNSLNITMGKLYDQYMREATNWSVTLETYFLTLSVGAQANVSLTIGAPGPKEAPAGTVVSLMVLVKSISDPNLSQSVKLLTTVNQDYELTITQKNSPQLDPNEATAENISLALVNPGNMPHDLEFMPISWPEGINVTALPDAFDLDIGEKRTVNLSLEIDPLIKAGSYQLPIAINSTQASKIFSKSLSLDIIRPDFRISKTGIQIPSNLQLAVETTITVTVENIGTAPGSDVKVRLEKDNVTIGELVAASIAAGSTKDLEFDVTFNEPGFTLSAIADYNNKTYEIDEDNNEATKTYSMEFDIAADSLSFTPLSPKAGQSVDITVAFINNEFYEFTTPFRISFYHDSVAEENKIADVTFSDTFKTGQKYARNTTWAIPEGTNQTVIICVKLDSLNAISETDETNNIISKNLTLAKNTGGGDDDIGMDNNTLMVIVVVIVLIVIVLGIYFYMQKKGKDEEDEDEDEEAKDEEGKKKPDEEVGGEKEGTGDDAGEDEEDGEYIEMEIMGEDSEGEPAEEDEDEARDTETSEDTEEGPAEKKHHEQTPSEDKDGGAGDVSVSSADEGEGGEELEVEPLGDDEEVEEEGPAEDEEEEEE